MSFPAVGEIERNFATRIGSVGAPQVESQRAAKEAPASGAARVLYPGEPEYEAEQDRHPSGIPLPAEVATQLERIGRSLDLEQAWEHLVAGRGPAGKG